MICIKYSKRKTATGGTAIGLAMAMSLAEAHAGFMDHPSVAPEEIQTFSFNTADNYFLAFPESFSIPTNANHSITPFKPEFAIQASPINVFDLSTKAVNQRIGGGPQTNWGNPPDSLLDQPSAAAIDLYVMNYVKVLAQVNDIDISAIHQEIKEFISVFSIDDLSDSDSRPSRSAHQARNASAGQAFSSDAFYAQDTAPHIPYHLTTDAIAQPHRESAQPFIISLIIWIVNSISDGSLIIYGALIYIFFSGFKALAKFRLAEENAEQRKMPSRRRRRRSRKWFRR